MFTIIIYKGSTSESRGGLLNHFGACTVEIDKAFRICHVMPSLHSHRLISNFHIIPRYGKCRPQDKWQGIVSWQALGRLEVKNWLPVGTHEAFYCEGPITAGVELQNEPVVGQQETH